MAREHKSQKAFYHYLGLGPDRTLAKVAAELGISQRCLETYSSRDKWVARAKEYDAEQFQEAVDAAARKRQAEIEEMNARHVQVGMTAQERAVKQIEELIASKNFGSLAAVQLLKLAIDIERAAREIPERLEVSGKDGGPVVIWTQWGTPQVER